VHAKGKMRTSKPGALVAALVIVAVVTLFFMTDLRHEKVTPPSYSNSNCATALAPAPVKAAEEVASSPKPLPAFSFLQCMKTPEDRSNMDLYYQKGGDPGFQMKLDYLNADSIVFELGGNKGGFVQFVTHTKLYVFEPVQSMYEYLLQHYGPPRFPQVQIFHYGIASESGTAHIVLEGAQGSASSQFNIANEAGKQEEGELVYMRTMTQVMLETKVTNIDLLNINCEGCEFNILESLVEQNVLPNITHIQVQFHPGIIKDGSARRCRIREYLIKTHYESYNIEWIWERWTRRT